MSHPPKSKSTKEKPPKGESLSGVWDPALSANRPQGRYLSGPLQGPGRILIRRHQAGEHKRLPH